MSQNFRVLVVGATGNVGSSLIAHLLQRSDAPQVVAATRNPGSTQLPTGVQAVAFDPANPSTWTAALQGISHLFLMSPPGHADAYGLLAPFLNQALGQLKRVVLMTAAGVEYDDSIPLRRLELLIEASGVEFGVLRPSWFMQNFRTFWWPGVLATGNILVPAADSRTAFVDADDIGAMGAALLLAETAPNRAFTITGPESLTYAEAAAVLTRETGRPIGYESISDADFHQALLGAGLPPDYAGMLVGMFGMVRMGAAAAISPDVESVLGRPATSLATYARRDGSLYAG
jgi:uncharacterized protein YbjT (DUF2867 family)